MIVAQESPDNLSDRARALASSGRVEEADRLWRQALQVAPDHFPSLFNLGYLAVQRGRDDEAIRWLEAASKRNPRDFNSYYLLGMACSRLGKTPEALEAWRNALALQPTNRKLMKAMSVEYSKAQQFAEAAAIAERALVDESFYLLAIQARLEAGQPDQAFALARKALAKFPSSARANFEVGFHLHKTGRWDEAMPYLARAVQADPAYEEPYYLRGDVLLRREAFAEAEGEFRMALQRRAAYTAARLGLARTLAAQHKFDEAIEELTMACKIDPNNPQPYLLLSQTYFKLGRLEEAKAAKEKSASLR